ncbi:MAG: MFS transporter [Actinobacteria bacterium]|nr:MAG: MFS transporter [Actinomycetota bacterium]
MTRAHRALVAGFVVLGAIDGVWVARLPALKQKLSLDSGRLGIVIFAVSAVATLSLPLAGWLAARRGSRGPAAIGLVLASGALAAAAFVPSFAPMLLVACGLGSGIGVADVAMNAHGVELERRTGRHLLSPLHAAWSFGLLGGSAVTAASAAAGVGLQAELPAVAVALVLVTLVAAPQLLPGTAADVQTAHLALPRGALALPAVLMFCAFFVESAAMSWSAVFLSGPVGASAAVAAGAVVAYAAAMGVARLFGDRLLVRWGFGGLARRSGMVTCVGTLLAIATRATAPALVGFALVGIGCAAIVPALFRIGASMPGISQSAGVAAVATAGYTGGLVNGPAIGFVARGVGLSAALGLLVVAGGVIIVLGPRLGSRR